MQQLLDIPVAKIRPSKFPLQALKPPRVDELAASMKTHRLEKRP
jgi:ParB-like chromosome segregation protein Spo0J